MEINKKTLDKIVADSLIDVCVLATRLSGGTIEKKSLFSWTKNCYSEWYSKVFYINDENTLPLIRKEIEAGYAPPTLLIGGENLTKDMEDGLRKNNFIQYFEQTGMVFDLKKQPIDLSADAKKVVKVKTDNEILQWTEVINKSFGKNDDPMLYQLLQKENYIHFYGYLEDNRLVASTMVVCCGDIAGVHLVGTLDDFRGRGVATSIMRKVLSDAKAFGCELSVLQASKLGKPVYQKLGYQAVSKLTHWRYQL